MTGGFFLAFGGGGSAASVAEDGSFEVKNLLPGSYSVRLLVRNGEDFEHSGTIEVGSVDLEGVLIRPVRKDGRY